MRLVSLLDHRYRTVALENARLVPARIVIAFPLAAIAALVQDWRSGGAWLAAVLAIEALGFLVRPQVRKEGAEGAALAGYFWSVSLAMPVWSFYGVLMWTGESEAARIAAIAYWCGQLLYIQTTCLRSPVAAWQTVPISVAGPMIAPLVAPRFSGLEQALVMSMLGLCVAHALAAVWHSVVAGRRLQLATDALTEGKLAAEAAQVEMAVARGEAEQASQAKSEFLAAISHEIRTPLNGVLGMAQAMAADDLTPGQRERLDVITQSGEALLATLNDVLDLSKVEAGLLEIETIEFDLAHLVQGTVSAFSAVAEAKGLALSADIEARGVYRGDPVRLRQILQNLISNAIKFTDVGEVRVTVENRAPGLVFTVSDTGLGIAADAVERVFDAFTQADASTTRRFGGSGLGLTICRELAHRMGGEISVDSRPGEGTRFMVALPLARTAAELRERPREEEARPDARLRILVAEDNPVNQLVIRTLLGQVGVTPQVVGDGAQAVEAWRSGAWDVVLMDVQMPVMDGPSAARAIRAIEVEEGRGRTPILALTANAMTHQVEAYLAAGMDGYIAKPIKVEALYHALGEALGAAPDEATAAA